MATPKDIARLKKLRRPQRLKLVTGETRKWLDGLDEETLMGVHDYIHDLWITRSAQEVAARRATAEQN